MQCFSVAKTNFFDFVVTHNLLVTFDSIGILAYWPPASLICTHNYFKYVYMYNMYIHILSHIPIAKISACIAYTKFSDLCM